MREQRAQRRFVTGRRRGEMAPGQREVRLPGVQQCQPVIGQGGIGRFVGGVGALKAELGALAAQQLLAVLRG